MCHFALQETTQLEAQSDNGLLVAFCVSGGGDSIILFLIPRRILLTFPNRLILLMFCFVFTDAAFDIELKDKNIIEIIKKLNEAVVGQLPCCGK